MSKLEVPNDDGDLYVEEFSDEVLAQAVRNLAAQNKMISLENDIFERFFMRQDPSVLVAVQQILEFSSMPGNMSMSAVSGISGGQSARFLAMSSMMMGSPSKAGSSQGRFGGVVGTKVTIAQKSEMLGKEMELFKDSLESVKQFNDKQQFLLKAHLEELKIRHKELTDFKGKFDEQVVNAVDPVAKRIPAEAWIKYMNEWLSLTDSTISSIRLLTSTLKQRFHKLKSILFIKEELGKSLRPIDFEKLHIENQGYLTCIEKKSLQIIDVKKTTSEIYMKFNVQKNLLFEKSSYSNILKNSTIQRKLQIVDVKLDIKRMEAALKKYTKKYKAISNLRQTHTIPHIASYIQTKADFNELQNSIKNLLLRKSPI